MQPRQLVSRPLQLPAHRHRRRRIAGAQGLQQARLIAPRHDGQVLLAAHRVGQSRLPGRDPRRGLRQRPPRPRTESEGSCAPRKAAASTRRRSAGFCSAKPAATAR